MTMLEVEDLGIEFGGVRAVDGLSFVIPKGRIVSIIGPNGAGKTTLFNMISGIYRPSRGRIRLEGRDVTGVPPHMLARAGLSRTFQNLQIFFRLTALENVMVGRHLHEPKAILPHFLHAAVGQACQSGLRGEGARADRARRPRRRCRAAGRRRCPMAH